MIAWYYLIIMFVLGFVFAIILYTIFQDFEFLYIIFEKIFFITFFIPLFIYNVFFRHVLNPVLQENVNKYLLVSKNCKGKKICGKIWIFHDKEAKKLSNKIFLIKVLTDK